MLVKRAPDTFEKLHALTGMASDDILSRPPPGERQRAPYAVRERSPAPGVYKARMPNGKTISLMRVMYTDFCKYDCHYCPNSTWVPRKRFAFKPDELAGAFDEMRRRHMVSGLFLSSGIFGSGSKTTERLLRVIEIIRKKQGFRGYVHMKVMPDTEKQYVEEAYRLGTRLSINIESPTPEMLSRISPMKDMRRDILEPMSWIDDMMREDDRRGGPARGAVGQATQMVVGAADESDWDIFERMDRLYSDWNFKRVYYSPFQPVRHTPLEEHPATPMIREHRLYQVDWLKRVYAFDNDELKLAYDASGFLPHEDDPKTSIALANLDRFPVNVNEASREQLLRVPGVGSTSTDRILRNRARHSVDNWRDLQAMGVVRKWAWPFLAFPGHRPPRARQLRLDLSGEQAREQRKTRVAERAAAYTATTSASGGAAPCGQASSCTGCPLYGTPGHPGS